MRRFNPEKELRKIQKGNRNKVIYGVIALLLIIAIGSSYALYQIRYNKRIIYTTVAPFYSKDLQLAVYVDGVKKTESDSFPSKEEGYIYSHTKCENGGEASFDNKKWELEVKTKEQDRCDVYFIKENLPNEPELYQGMIPVVYGKNGIMYVADTESDWYNYQDHRWGNAVLVDASNPSIKEKYFKSDNQLREDIVGKEVPMEEVLQMYVWIPRYKYQLFNVDNKGVPKQLINIKFEKGIETTGNVSCTIEKTGKETCQNAENGNWYTHPAFTFGKTELKGIWVSKFEPSDSMNEMGDDSSIGEITILPNKNSMVNKKQYIVFEASRAIETNLKYNLDSNVVDTHMMKNIEWGAVAYLTQSIYGIYSGDGQECMIKDDSMNKENCEVWINNTVQYSTISGDDVLGGTYTGCVGDSVNAAQIFVSSDKKLAVCDATNVWNKKGVNASTTGNMYGIYDMNGGTMEYMMGVITTEEGGTEISYSNTGFQKENMPDSKYYDLYEFSKSAITQERGHLGDATREIMRIFGARDEAWNADITYFPSNFDSWFRRGGRASGKKLSGIFAYHYYYSGTLATSSFRVVITAD